MSISPRKNRIVVFSGGSAANNLIDVFKNLCGNSRSLDFILPISDNGGSTSEILRVCGGPGIGDVRSRLVRLAPEGMDGERSAIRNLLNYRLPADPGTARLEWYGIVEGTHVLWKGIPSEKRELLRSFFNHLNLELLKRQRPTTHFNFHSASTGNLFLTGARFFTGSFESAIYLFHSITGVPSNICVIPAINSNHAHHIAAGLADGSVIIGQNEISHPSASSASLLSPQDTPAGSDAGGSGADGEEEGEGGDNLPGSLASLRSQNIVFSKGHEDNEELSDRIERIWYINLYGEEIRPPANPKVISSLGSAGAVIYSIGSLYTSLMPCLVLRNIGKALAESGRDTPKILLLNGSHDRETGPDHDEFTATDFVRAIVRGCTSSMGEKEGREVGWNRFVTHLIYLEGNGAPVVDTVELKRTGIECMRVYGRKNPDGEGRGMLYDPTALAQTLETILAARTKRTDARRMTADAYGRSL
ncbi:unnamed protein product [Tuber aestivum]|uniref:Uncharacterized protein n=1 Tax=Tuber aestivum TaxID=59557 RepID=A0A292PQ81_9PEZI|nr:unnamed protein product [Tuber aestivum]